MGRKGDRHNVEYHTRHKLESHNIEIFYLLVITSKLGKLIVVITSKENLSTVLYAYY